jgi:hypothetical protein
VVLVGERRSDLAGLTTALANGSVSEVEVVGLPANPDWRGRTTITVRWQGRVMQRYAEVVVDKRRRQGDARPGDEIAGDPETYLRSFGPPVEITRSEPGASFRTEWREWRGPGWLALLGISAWFGTFLLAGSGPEPWRVTRWGWGWITLFGGPLGAVAYLLLGGPLGVLRPRDPWRRLSSGWAFVVALFLLGGTQPG